MEYAIKDEKKLVSISHNGEEKVLFDLDSTSIDNNGVSILPGTYRWFYYFYDKNDNNIYLSLIDENKNNAIAKLELSNNKVELLTTVKSTDFFPADIVKIKDDIYFSIDTLYSYNLKNKNINKLSPNSPNRSMSIKVYDNLIFYQTNESVYIYNVDTKEVKVISKSSSTAYVYKDKFIYYYIGTDGSTPVKDDELRYYIYDIKTEDITKASEIEGMQTMDEEYIVPIKDDFYSVSNNNIYKLSGKELTKFYTITCDDLNGIVDYCDNYVLGSINEFVKLTDNTVIIGLGDEIDGELFYVTFNVDTKEIKKIDYEGYSSIQYVD